jgi:short subunit dehydrogenase
MQPDVKASPIPGRVAIVTGGGRGLGRAMVLGLAHAGIDVVATAARERSEIEAVAEEVRQGCGESRVLPLIADVTQEDDCAEVVDAAVRRFGRLDIVVNNAGRGMKYVSDEFLTEPTRFWEVSPETWRLVIDTNVNGPFMMARHAVPVMLEARWGRIINVSVSQGTMRRRGFSPYGPFEGGTRIGDDHLGAGSRGHRGDRERAVTRRSDPDRHDPADHAGEGEIGAARSVDHGRAAAVARVAGRRWDDGPSFGGDEMAG